jgi:hypothetical protein
MMFDLAREMTQGFIWATGIENTFVPQTRAGMRSLDEYELTQHYKFWRSDFDLVAETGVGALAGAWYRVPPSQNSGTGGPTRHSTTWSASHIAPSST